MQDCKSVVSLQWPRFQRVPCGSRIPVGFSGMSSDSIGSSSQILNSKLKVQTLNSQAHWPPDHTDFSSRAYQASKGRNCRRAE